MLKQTLSDWLRRQRIFGGFKLTVHVVAWLDMMGQSNELQKLKPPANNQEETELRRIAAKAIGNVRLFREYVEKMRVDLSRFRLPKEMIGRIPGERRKLLPKYNRVRVFSRYVSDSAMLAISLEGSHRRPPFMSIESLLWQLRNNFLVMLFARIPIRAAVSLGYCGILDGGELYGAGVSNAYKMEQMAVYPRITIDRDLIEYLRSWHFAEGSNAEKQINRGFIRVIEDGLEEDPKDGRLIVSYIGQKYPPPFASKGDLTRTCSFIEEQIARLEGSGQPHEADKYKYLKEYFQRGGHWLLDGTEKAG